MTDVIFQVYIHIILAVKGGEKLISEIWKDEFCLYIAGIIKAKKQELIIVNSMPDHLHAFIGLTPLLSLEDLVKEIKNNSADFINKQKWLNRKFCWEKNYWAFSYAHSDIEEVYNYITNQEEHHKRKSFRDELMDFLKLFEADDCETYLFEYFH